MGVLAINGGTPVLPDGLKTRWPIFDDAERRALLEVLESGSWCSAGHPGKVAQAMEAFAEFIGTKHAMACTSGTTALELGLRACGLRRGDEVILPAATFLASASAIAVANGVPVFVDIDPETYQIAPDAVEAAVTERTVGIMPVHYGGYPSDMDRIADIAARRGLFIVEDCAEAHGTEWRGRKVGSLGTVGAFSFQMGKPLTAGEGGAVTYDDDALEMRHYQYARTRIGSSGEKETVHYPAGNWRMSEFVGAILLAQLARIREQTDIRYTNHLYFADGLDEIDGISALKRDPRITKQGFYFYLMRYDPARWNGVHRDRFMAALRAEGVRCGTAHNDPVYWYEAFRDMPEIDHSRIQCPQAERIYRTEVVALGKDFLMAREHCDRILDALRKIRDNLDELANAS